MRSCLLRNLPDDLADRILRVTGQTVLTKGILKMVEDYLDKSIELSNLRVRVLDLEHDLSLAREIISDEIELSKRKADFIELSPDRFQLHGD